MRPLAWLVLFPAFCFAAVFSSCAKNNGLPSPPWVPATFTPTPVSTSVTPTATGTPTPTFTVTGSPTWTPTPSGTVTPVPTCPRPLPTPTLVSGPCDPTPVSCGPPPALTVVPFNGTVVLVGRSPSQTIVEIAWDVVENDYYMESGNLVMARPRVYRINQACVLSDHIQVDAVVYSEVPPVVPGTCGWCLNWAPIYCTAISLPPSSLPVSVSGIGSVSIYQDYGTGTLTVTATYTPTCTTETSTPTPTPTPMDMGYLEVRPDPGLSDATASPGSTVPVFNFSIVPSFFALAVTGITLKASGTGNDATGIDSVDLWDDANADGVLETGETRLASAAYGSDNGTAALSGFPAVTISAHASHAFIVTYTFSGSAQAGTYQASMDYYGDVTGTVVSTGAADLHLNNAPVSGAVITVGGPTATSTPTFDGTGTPTWTPTFIPSATPTPSGVPTLPACPNTADWGDNVPGGGTVNFGGMTEAQRYTLAQDATVKKIWIDLASPATLRVGLYSDFAGYNWPLALLYSSGDRPMTTGLNSVDVPDVVLAAGAYWLAYAPQGGPATLQAAAGSSALRASRSDLSCRWMDCTYVACDAPTPVPPGPGTPAPTPTAMCTPPPASVASGQGVIYAEICR